MKTWSFFEPETGRFTGRKFSGPEGALQPNVPDGLDAIEGDFDHLSQKVNVVTRSVEDWIPPRPLDTEMTRHEWDHSGRRWIATPTLQSHKLRARRRYVAEIREIESRQARALRDALLSASDAERTSAMARIADIEASIASLRKKLEAINLAESEAAIVDLTSSPM